MIHLIISLFKRIKKAFLDLKMRHKLTLSYILIILIPLCGMGVYTYKLSIDNITEQSINNTEQGIKMVAANISNTIERYLVLADNIYFNDKVRLLMTEVHEGIKEFELIQYKSSVLSLLHTTGKSTNLSLIRYAPAKMESITNNFDRILSYSVDSNILEQENKQSVSIYNAKRVEDREWFKQLKDKTLHYVWAQVEQDGYYGNISLLREFVRITKSGYKTSGLLKLTVRLTDLLNAGYDADNSNYNYLVLDQNNHPFILNSHMQQLYDTHKQNIENLITHEPDKGIILNDISMVYTNLESTSWKVVYIMNLEEYTRKADNIKKLTIYIGISAMLLLLIISELLASLITKRIMKVSKYVVDVKNGNFDAVIHDSSNDEIGVMTTGLTEMVNTIKQLIQEVYRTKLEKRDAQLKMIQSQINPHFLYNSLSAINFLVLKGELKKINQMVKALSTFYRLTLSKGADIISISNEVMHLKAYLEVFSIRMEKSFRVNYDIDEEALNYGTLKVILQPMVENIFEHAIGNRTTPININISIKTNERDVIFKVIDDGVGISREVLSKILTHDAGSVGYGVRNVNDRIVLQFAEPYGVRMCSYPGAGTSVTIVIPKFRISEHL